MHFNRSLLRAFLLSQQEKLFDIMYSSVHVPTDILLLFCKDFFLDESIQFVIKKFKMNSNLSTLFSKI